MRAEGQEFGGNGFANFPALIIKDIELCNVVDVPLDADLLADIVTKLVVGVKGAELLNTLVSDEGGVGLHEQHRRIFARRCRLFIAGAVLVHLDRCNPFLPGVLESPVLPGVVLLVFPLRPLLEELIHREQLAALKHFVNVLLPLGVGAGACEGARVALKPTRELVAYRLEKPLNGLVPRLIWERPSDFLDADALVEAHRLGVKLEVDVPLLAGLPGQGLRGVVPPVVDVQDLRDAPRLAVDHLDE
ncbi:hypothetical protein SDC9_104422 [bioreactor metagenome]|uniref:Uncharacterized protein n=1 Tax=bioreactor metagenome TaxID=1076179 RepID=A0A645AWR3_9ZZZZ